MKYFLFKFFLFGIALFIFAEILVLFIDSKQNGFSTLSVNHNITASGNHKHMEILFTAEENYLGTVLLPLSSSKKGKVSFKIKENGATSWYQQNLYSADVFNLTSSYPFGFPAIADSKDKQYLIQIDSIDSAEVNLKNFEMQSKYVYPREKIIGSLSHREVLAAFILKKLETIPFGPQLLLYSFLCSFIFLRTRLLFFLTKYIGKRILSLFVVLPLLLFIALPFSLLNHSQIYPQKIVEWIWISFAFLILLIVSKYIKRFFLTKSDKEIQRYILICFSIVSFIAFIIATLNKTYILGGDDSRTFYLYPLDFFINHTSHIGPDGAVSGLTNFLPPTSIAAFSIFIIILKKIFFFLNLQMVLFVANLIGGMVFFYILSSYLLPGKSLVSFLARCVGSLLYVFSIFNFYTLLNAQLIAMYLISTFPLSMYLYIKGIKERKLYLIALVAVIWSVFSYFVIALPWFIGAFIGFSPIIIWLFWKQKKRFLLYNGFLLGLLLLLNAYWIYTVSFSLISSSSISNNTTIISNTFRKEHDMGIIEMTEKNKVFFPLLNLYHYDIQADFQWPYYSIFTSWYLKLLPLNCFFIVLVLLTGIKMKESSVKGLYIAGVLGLLLSIYFFTVNIGSHGINLFLFLNNHIPGFVMFRNMYDKFGFAIALNFALLITICLQYLLNNQKNNSVKMALFSLAFFIILLNAKPFLFNEFYTLPIWTTKNTYNTVTGLNHDYLNLVQYIKDEDNPSRYLWLPLNTGNISQIQDEKNLDHYYSGVSPLLFLSGKNDYSGLNSFEAYAPEIAKDISKRKYAELGDLYRKFNARYIIVNHTINADIQQSYICGERICEMQDKFYKKAFLGKKIKDFGSRYSLYEINPRYLNDKIYLQNNEGNVTYKKISSTEYKVDLTGINKNAQLVFLDPYFANWELYSQQNYPLKGNEHSKIFGYANAWSMNTDELKASMPKSEYTENSDGTIDISLKLLFQKSILYPIAIVTSIIAYTIILGYSLFLLLRRILKNKK